LKFFHIYQESQFLPACACLPQAGQAGANCQAFIFL